MIKEITQSEIETLKYMFKTFPESTRKTLIENQCQKYKLTDEFIVEFKEYITNVDFSRSPDLDYSTIQKHDTIFDINAWNSNPERSLEPMLHDEFVGKYLGGTDIDSVLLGVKPSQITNDIFQKYFKQLGNDARSFFLNSSRITSEAFLREFPEDINEEIFRNKYAKIEWSNDLIEYILSNKTLTVKFLVSILQQTKDIGFVRRMLTSDFDYKQTGETFDTDLKNFLFNIHQDLFPVIFEKLELYSPNAITYSLLERMLEVNSFLEESFLTQNAEHFIRNGLTGKLAQYARRNEYESVLLVLKLQ
jgi:hypothetical protein